MLGCSFLTDYLFKSALNILCRSIEYRYVAVFTFSLGFDFIRYMLSNVSILVFIEQCTSYPLPRSACQLSVDMSSEKKLNQLSSNHGGNVRRWRRGGVEES